MCDMGLGQSRERAGARHPSAGAPQVGAGRKETAAVKKSWTEDQIARLILEKKLAPRVALNNQSVDRTTECPICFNDLEHLNAVMCCNQFICTDCYVKIRRPGEVNCICPFCDSQGFPVTPVVDDSSAAADPSTPATATTSSSASSLRRKQPTSPIHIPLATKADRDSIEKEIQSSRSLSQHDEFYGNSFSSGPRGSRSSSEFSAAGAGQGRFIASMRRASAGAGAGAGAGSPQSRPSGSEDAIREISRMLQGSTLADVNELMLLAAIRQSMAEQQGSQPAAGSGSVSAGPRDPAVSPPPAPPSPARSSLTATAASTPPLPSLPPPSPPPPPPHSPAAAGASTASSFATPDQAWPAARERNGSSNGSSSIDSERNGSSSIESEMSEMTEEEQLQLAISLSLTPTSSESKSE